LQQLPETHHFAEFVICLIFPLMALAVPTDRGEEEDDFCSLRRQF